MLVSGRLEKDASVMAADVGLFSTSNQVSSWETRFSMPRLEFGIRFQKNLDGNKQRHA
jgi:hypothetical protein